MTSGPRKRDEGDERERDQPLALDAYEALARVSLCARREARRMNKGGSMKVRILLAMVLTIAFALAGCSGGETETATEAATETVTTSGTTDATPTGRAGSPTGSTGASGDVLAAFPADSFEGVVDRATLSLDAEGCDGTPSLLAEATEPAVYQLFTTGDIDVEGALLVYTAKVRTHELEGDAMLEMWCVFGEMGEFFSRGMDSTLTGTQDWTELMTVFRLEPGQNPDNVKLNLVVGGAGRVWIDDIKVTRAPL